jgi:hypothetical protein
VLNAEKNREQQRTTANAAADRVLELYDFFVSEKWHRPYAKVLQETDATKLPTVIAEAEDAIFDRCLELCISPGAIEQSLDLQRAVSVLAQLKKLHMIECNLQNFVS